MKYTLMEARLSKDEQERRIAFGDSTLSDDDLLEFNFKIIYSDGSVAFDSTYRLNQAFSWIKKFSANHYERLNTFKKVIDGQKVTPSKFIVTAMDDGEVCYAAEKDESTGYWHTTLNDMLYHMGDSAPTVFNRLTMDLIATPYAVSSILKHSTSSRDNFRLPPESVGYDPDALTIAQKQQFRQETGCKGELFGHLMYVISNRPRCGELLKNVAEVYKDFGVKFVDIVPGISSDAQTKDAKFGGVLYIEDPQRVVVFPTDVFDGIIDDYTYVE